MAAPGRGSSEPQLLKRSQAAKPRAAHAHHSIEEKMRDMKEKVRDRVESRLVAMLLTEAWLWCVRRHYWGVVSSDAALSGPWVAYKPVVRMLAATTGFHNLPEWAGSFRRSIG